MADNQAIDTGLKHTDGREIFELRHTIMAENRDRPIPTTKKEKKKAINNTSIEDSEQEPLPLFSENLVRQKWRILSKVKAWPHTGYWEPQCVDYSSAEDSVIKNLIDHIAIKPDLRWDHSYSIKDVAGWIEDAEWEDVSDIEAGVNAWVVADSEYDAKAAIGLKKGIIRSGSVGINARLVKSHPNMDMEEFVTSQGKIVDNNEVRWIPVEITNCEHMALVPYRLGADPNAGIREKKVTATNVVATNTVSNKEKDIKPETVKISQGGREMTNFEELFGNICHVLGVDSAIDDEASAKQVAQAVSNKLMNLKESYRSLVALQQGLYDCEKYLLEDSETGLKSDEIVRRLPEKLKYAENGKKFLDFQKAEALKWFDMAVVQPDVDMSDNDKRIRSRISNSYDLEYIEEQLTLYRELSNGRFGPDRSSAIEEIPAIPSKPVPQIKNKNDVDRLFSGGKK